MLGSRQVPGFPAQAPIEAPAPSPSPLPALMAAPQVQLQDRGVWGRVDDAVRAPGMANAFLRAAGAAFDGGGLGGMLRAGSGGMEDYREQQRATAQQQFENQFRMLKEQHDYDRDKAAAGKVSWTAVPDGGTVFGHYSDGRPVGAMPGAQASPPGAGPTRIASAADYAALAPGAEFIAPDGSHRRKGGAPSPGGATFP